jgi:hypothetical protein
MRVGWRLLIAGAIVLGFLCASTSAGAAGKCDTGDDLHNTGCSLSISEVGALVTAAQSDGYEYEFERYCDDGSRGRLCRDPVVCTDLESSSNGFLSYVMRRDVAPPVDVEGWVDVGTYCNDGDPKKKQVFTEALALAKFKAHDWATADIMVQPVGGRTLVNFPTNAYTTLTESSTIAFTMFGQDITIAAEPVEYTWH